MSTGIRESQNIEFKPAWRDEYLKTICAFANTGGGTLLIGMGDKGKALGAENAERLLEDIPNKIKNKLGVTPSVAIESRDGKNIMKVDIKSANMPVSYNGKYYRRSGSTTSELNGSELTHFLLDKLGTTWDSLPTEINLAGADGVIDKDAVELFKSLTKKRIPALSETDSTEKIFRNLELVTEDNKLTKAALLLFGKNPQRYVNAAKTRVGRFRGSEILDTVIADGSLFRQVEVATEAVKKHLSVRFETRGIAREDIWDYPLDAVREAVINAVIHKDYLSTAEIQIKIYDDKARFWNPGNLPEELSPEALKEEHSSYPRNRLIANAFYLAGLIEQWGSGTKRIVDLCKEQELPEPEYKEEQGGFGIWFYKDIYSEENLRKMELSERQIKAVLYVKDHGKITNKDYREISGISKPTTTRDLADLVDKNILGIKGKGKRDIHYILIKPKMSQK